VRTSSTNALATAAPPGPTTLPRIDVVAWAPAVADERQTASATNAVARSNLATIPQLEWTMTLPKETPNDIEIRRARTLARALDTVIGIPGTPLRFGVDAILGLIPGAGDVAGAVLSAYIVLVASRRGAPPSLLWRMLANVAIDTALGTVPLVGDLFDVAWKSNTMNAELLERFAAEPQKVTTRSRVLGILVVMVVLLALVGLGVLSFMLARALWRVISG
jgi:hypothetical protein